MAVRCHSLSPRPRGRTLPEETDLSDAILVCDQDVLFREALRNFLLAAGYCRVEVAATPREALPKLRWHHYR